MDSYKYMSVSQSYSVFIHFLFSFLPPLSYYGRKNNGPQRCPHPKPFNLRTGYLTWKKKLSRIRVKTLRWESLKMVNPFLAIVSHREMWLQRKAQKDVPLTAPKTEKGSHKPRSTEVSRRGWKTQADRWSQRHAFLTTPWFKSSESHIWGLTYRILRFIFVLCKSPKLWYSITAIIEKQHNYKILKTRISHTCVFPDGQSLEVRLAHRWAQ